MPSPTTSQPSTTQISTAGTPFQPHPSTQNVRPNSSAHHSTRAPNAPSSGSQTITQAQPHTRQPVLRLRGEDVRINDGQEGEAEGTGRSIRWAEDVIDNEGLGRKSSKVCCIYHAPRNIDSSSDESSSSDDSDSDSADDGSARPAGARKDGKAGHKHKHGDDCAHGKGKARSRSPNAYEKMPTVRKPGGNKP